MTRKDFIKSITYVDFINAYNDYYLFMSIFDDCFHLASVAIKELCSHEKNIYYIKNTLQFNRIWNLTEEIDFILSLDNSALSDWINNNREIYKGECEKELLEFCYVDNVDMKSLDSDIDTQKEVEKIKLYEAKRKSKKKFFQPKLPLFYQDF